MQRNVHATEEADRDAARLLNIIDKVPFIEVIHTFVSTNIWQGYREMGTDTPGRHTILDTTDGGVCWKQGMIERTCNPFEYEECDNMYHQLVFLFLY